jgi:acyl carrier protein
MTDEISKRVLDILAEDVCEPVTAATPFHSLKMDSLDYLNFILHVEEAFDVRIPGDLVAEFETGGDVIAWLEADACA